MSIAARRLSRTSPQPLPAASYPGDPGPSVYYVGWALGPGNSTVPTAQSNPGWPAGKVSIIHDYSTTTNTRVHASKLDAAISRGMIPSQSFRLNTYTPAQIVAGSADADIDASAADCLARAPYPIWLCYYHEPEDNFTTAGAAADYRAAYRYIVTRFRAAGVTNVAWMPIYMCPWTFRNASGRDWRWWHADWNGGNGAAGWHSDIMMDLMGLDVYNPMPGGTQNESFASMINEAVNKIAASGAPEWDIVIPEFGMSWNATNPVPDWVDWATLARNHALANRVKSFTYWDNSTVEPGRYSFGSTYDPTGNKLDGWNVIVDGASVRPGL